MSVTLRPSSTLGFNRPLTQVVKRVLSVANNNDHPVAFKVKTTAPKLYCVRPNSGRIEPGHTLDVQVLLQAMKEEPPLNMKCKDKFLIQSTIITPEKDQMSLHDLWVSLEGQDARVHSQKVKVAYLPLMGQDLTEVDENEISPRNSMGRDRTPTRVETPFLHEPLPPHDRVISPANADYAVPEDSEHPEPLHIGGGFGIPVYGEARPEPRIATPASHKHITPTEEELRTQLAAAMAEIQRLRTLLESVPEPSPSNDEGLRRRRVPTSDSGTMVSDSAETDIGTVVESVSVQTDGVPPQIVLLISLLIFIMTYVFF